MVEFISEEALAGLLGVDRDKLRKVRPASAYKKNGTVEWPWRAAEDVATAMGLSLAEKIMAGPDAGEALTVCSSPGPAGWHYGNHFLIQARRAGGEVVVVRVMDSRKYLPKMRDGKPMVLRAKKADAGNWWLLVGREPRWKGVW